ncbi:uncharacterized protein NEMAJ01_0348 [Nematocida major]|uniref:uncharacterized protein n=1 Tax=Nematocida major TaxID=1912982 RepID=UPI0020085EE9|nr:uncharacterized protein NEMAJ01_0348 [Nematocida major]KAH9385452.1 hypothetical protein NEMAJ01_0348 [Nematocida major]
MEHNRNQTKKRTSFAKKVQKVLQVFQRTPKRAQPCCAAPAAAHKDKGMPVAAAFTERASKSVECRGAGPGAGESQGASVEQGDSTEHYEYEPSAPASPNLEVPREVKRLIRGITAIAKSTYAMNDASYLPVILLQHLRQESARIPSELEHASQEFHGTNRKSPMRRKDIPEESIRSAFTTALTPTPFMTNKFMYSFSMYMEYTSMWNSVMSSIFKKNKNKTRSEDTILFYCYVLKFIRELVSEKLSKLGETFFECIVDPEDEGLQIEPEDEEECSAESTASNDEAPSQDTESAPLESTSVQVVDELQENPLFKRQREKYNL